MPRRVGDDEGAPWRREVAVGDVDRDALFALRGKTVEKEGEVELASLRSDALRIGRQRVELVLEERAALIEQPADQRALPVVDAAARQEAQEVAILALLEQRLDVDGYDRCAQKYPSRFFFSIDASLSRSISRPCRSDVELASISSMISATVPARLGTAPDSG